MLRRFLLLISLASTAVVMSACGSTGPDTTPPLTPEGFRRSGGGDGENTLAWLANREGDLAGYRLYRTEGDPAAAYALIAALHPDTVSYTDRSLDYTIQYYYKLTAFDNAENESTPTLPELAIPANLSPPAAPANVHAVAQNIAVPASITTTWSPNSEGDFAEYLLYRDTQAPVSTSGSPHAVIQTGTTIYVDNAVSVETRYFYKVVARDKGGLQSPPSQSTDVSDIALPPPTLITPTNGGTAPSLTPTLSWQPVSQAEGYRIVVGTDPTFTVQVWNDHVTSLSTSVTYDGVALSSGSQYFWYLVTTTVDPSRSNSRSSTWSFVAP